MRFQLETEATRNRMLCKLHEVSFGVVAHGIGHGYTTGSPSSKYEHWQASALLRNNQNIRICMGKKPIVSVTYENEKENRLHKNP